MTRRDSPLVAIRCRIAAISGLAIATLCVPVADATICKYVDADGATHYTNVPPDKGWRKISCDVADDAPPRPRAPSSTGGAKASTPTGFPRVEPDTQKNRDELRRRVLSDELASEEQALTEARGAYGSGAPPPLADEQNDAEKYRQRIARLRQAVQLHERNVDALRKEIAGLR
jgi:hypothetical protein